MPAGLDSGPGEQPLGPGLALEFFGAVELGVGDHEDIAELGGRPDAPAVPVVMTSFGRASFTICCHSWTIGAETPSVARCSSDFTASTSTSPILT